MCVFIKKSLRFHTRPVLSLCNLCLICWACCEPTSLHPTALKYSLSEADEGTRLHCLDSKIFLSTPQPPNQSCLQELMFLPSNPWLLDYNYVESTETIRLDCHKKFLIWYLTQIRENASCLQCTVASEKNRSPATCSIYMYNELFGTTDTEAAILDLHLSISNGFVSSKIYDKRDDFDFDIVKFPFSPFYLLRRLHFSTYSVCLSV